MSARDASLARHAHARAWEEGTSLSVPCPTCGGTDRRPVMVAVPHPKQHKGPCVPECDTPGYMCRSCRVWTPSA